jgi:transcriptional antiterminator NusG
MQDNETEPTPADHIHDGSESAALEQQQTTDPSLSANPIAHNSSSDEEIAQPETATLPEDEDDEDDGPVELEDPFSGSENAKPVMLDGEDEEIEDPTPAVGEMDWYILKVQSNREDSIRETLQRRIAMQGMDQWFGEVVVPKEQVTEFKSGKKRIVQKKLYPGYILVNMILSDETWFLVRETGGIGDFTGSGGKPSPMLPQDVAKLLNKGEEKAEETPKLKINFKKGDRVKINEGTFENFEGEVEQIDEANGRVTVMLSIFGRSTPVDIEYWQIETV